MMLSFAACAMSSGSHAATSGAWAWQQSVQFEADHDPSRVVLRNGTDTMNLEVIYDGLAWKQVDAWPKGKALQLAYSEKTGTVLVDPVSGKSVTVLDGLKTQPIDRLLDACLKKAVSTRDIEGCYGEAYHRWDAQMNLWYRRFMASKDADIDTAAKESMRVAQRQWLKYRDAQFDALSDLYGHRSGTIWPVIAMRKRIALPRTRARALASYLQVF
ncbi:lysozyme inhibitor LprI family protein [Oleiagrimonas sp. MCCC 1A03011]|uniref:lysozyme inhibitor LprI family protein n=1 Tax=Oleiagrimonas sp. MCCC 1A03011 TaxID=1926883 RepID=UPI00143D73EC|nr:lysozyme inhibitor LprI family protein [Oleiagrimonas sp. MCCC 1A03011]